MDFSPDGKKIILKDKDNKWKIRDIEDKNEKILFEGENFNYMDFSPDNTKIKVQYEDGRGKIRGKNEKILFQGENISRIFFSPDGTRIIVKYIGGTGEIRDLEDYNRSIIFTELKPKDLLLIFALKNLHSSNIDDLAAYRSPWKSLSFDLKGKLLKSYLSKKVVEFLGGRVEMIILAAIKRKKIIAQISALILLFSIIVHKQELRNIIKILSQKLSTVKKY